MNVLSEIRKNLENKRGVKRTGFPVAVRTDMH
ncbi:MAG: hypothetical protein A4E73_00719 [Syntrophaceae bacterium PtaU1.Bin231]|nr:MAG: hypothetical protein A4E73_00719 [Syntrophaceae bacterium PtaU1.Bin231]